ncbi:histidine kinase OS=Streptomyces fumanus OX=67302 GN=GCM10018772_27710 PE=4 SV=1 [Streptomyces fumanus]
MTEYIENPLFWALLVAFVATSTMAVRQRRTVRLLRQEIQGLGERYTELETGYEQSVRAAQEQAEEETKTVLKSAMRTLQGLAAEQQLVLSRLQSKYGDSAMLQDLLEIDHTNSQFGRRAQSIAVLCDGWLGGRRDTASVYDVVRSAQGRIRHFRRVEILSQVDFGITSRAVEPVALALAELLDNATSYSSPDTVVEINIRTVPKGICVVVDDAGVGMSDEERTRAEKLLSSERASGVAGLGNPPQFGFAVIGLLCERFGFEVSVDTSSPYGGVRAVVLLPHGCRPPCRSATPRYRPPEARATVRTAVDAGEGPARRPAAAGHRRRAAPAAPQAADGHRARQRPRGAARGPFRLRAGADHGRLPAGHADRPGHRTGGRGPHQQHTWCKQRRT